MRGYSDNGKANRPFFLARRNDFILYVEDTAKTSKKFYLRLINNIFDGEIGVRDIFPLGNKRKVIEEAAGDRRKQGAVSIYLVDGDFDLALDIANYPAGVVRVPAYCIENFLFEEPAIVAAANILDGVNGEDEIHRKLSFPDIKRSAEDKLIDVFVSYAVCYKNNIPIRTSSRSVHDLIDDESGVLCPDKVSERIKAIYQDARGYVSMEVFLRDFCKIKTRVVGAGDLLRFVCGKRYLMPLIFKRLRSDLRLNVNDDIVKQNIVDKVSARELKQCFEREFQRQTASF